MALFLKLSVMVTSSSSRSLSPHSVFVNKEGMCCNPAKWSSQGVRMTGSDGLGKLSFLGCLGVCASVIIGLDITGTITGYLWISRDQSMVNDDWDCTLESAEKKLDNITKY